MFNKKKSSQNIGKQSEEQVEKPIDEIDKIDTIIVDSDESKIKYSEFSDQEFDEIAEALSSYHSIFNIMWKLGKPVFSNSIPTACVEFSKLGHPTLFVFNEEYWNSKDIEQKKFIVCHECLHVLYLHGLRTIKQRKANSSFDERIANVALDLVVNHKLTNKFGFVRKKVDPGSKYCWIDTVFKDGKYFDKNNKYVNKKNAVAGGTLTDVEYYRNYEYYYEILSMDAASGANSNQIGQGQDTVDIHKDASKSSQSQEDLKDAIKEIFDGLESILSEDQKEEFDASFAKDIDPKLLNESGAIIGGKLAGTKPSGKLFSFEMRKVKKSKKWESIILEWAMKQIKDNYQEQWARTARRLEFLKTEFFIPSEYEEDAFEKEKIIVWFFMDASGSCSGYVQRFLKVAHSLPEDKFDVKFHSFDTEIVESELGKGKVAGFGGTSFNNIEKFIQEKIKKNDILYPKAVFVLTDGWGDRVIPQYPKNWYWLLTDKNNIKPTDYFPAECNVFDVKNYE